MTTVPRFDKKSLMLVRGGLHVLRIGMIDLDTSHPAAWVPIFRRYRDVEVTAVYDSGSVYDPGYVDKFASKYGIDQVCRTVSDMVSLVDGVVILGCNWDLHLEQTLPFVAAGKPVFIDKPVVGSLTHIRRLEELLRRGADIIGGSGSVFAPQIEDVRDRFSQADIHAMMATCPNDLFYYGIHTFEAIASVMGADFQSVLHLGGISPALFRLSYVDGRYAVLQLQTPAGRPRFLISHTKGTDAVDLVREDPYGPLIKRIVDHFAKKETYPISMADVLQSCRAGIAAKLSMESGSEVFLSKMPGDARCDGYAFAGEYRVQQQRRLAAR